MGGQLALSSPGELALRANLQAAPRRRLRMEHLPAAAERSIRRSRHRQRLLMLLASMREAYAGQLARALGVHSSRIRWMLHGRLPYYQPSLGLCALGLVEETNDGRGRLYVITRRGERKARSLAKRYRMQGTARE